MRVSADSSALDAVVGCISGLRFEQIAPWVVSLDACGFRGRRVVIHFRVDSQTVAELNQRAYEFTMPLASTTPEIGFSRKTRVLTRFGQGVSDAAIWSNLRRMRFRRHHPMLAGIFDRGRGLITRRVRRKDSGPKEPAVPNKE